MIIQLYNGYLFHDRMIYHESCFIIRRVNQLNQVCCCGWKGNLNVPKSRKTCKTHMVIKNSNQKLILQCKLIAKVWIIIIKSKKLSSLMEYLKCICLKYFRNNLLNRKLISKAFLSSFYSSVIYDKGKIRKHSKVNLLQICIC